MKYNYRYCVGNNVIFSNEPIAAGDKIVIDERFNFLRSANFVPSTCSEVSKDSLMTDKGVRVNLDYAFKAVAGTPDLPKVDINNLSVEKQTFKRKEMLEISWQLYRDNTSNNVRNLNDFRDEFEFQMNYLDVTRVVDVELEMEDDLVTPKVVDNKIKITKINF